MSSGRDLAGVRRWESIHVQLRADEQQDGEGGSAMAGGKSDELKGRVKEAVGALTDDKKLKREGKVDQAVVKVKQNVEKVVDKVKDVLKG
jgi:uncharacterized protein YjbJ (UPF0337 family)